MLWLDLDLLCEVRLLTSCSIYVLRQFPSGFPTTVRVPRFWMLASGSLVARDDGLVGCHRMAPRCFGVVRHLVRAIVSLWGEVVEFKAGAQLGGGHRDATKGPILSHGYRA